MRKLLIGLALFLLLMAVILTVFGQNIRALFAASTTALGGEEASGSVAYGVHRKRIADFGSHDEDGFSNEPNWNTESYQHVADNAFLSVAEHPLSTFSIDVDTASYSNVRRFLQRGQLPPKDAVRLEELVNYFKYKPIRPTAGVPLGAITEVAPCPWNPRHLLASVRVGTAPIENADLPARNLVLLIDVSGSMDEPNKLPLVKAGVKLLVETLKPTDRIAIVTYAAGTRIALEPTSGAHRSQIAAAIDGLQAGGGTNGAGGIQLAYELAHRNLVKGAINRVLLATDGDFNLGVTSQGDLQRLIESEREGGVYLTVLGFGMGNYKDSTLKTLAQYGNGNYAYIDTLKEAQKVLVSEAGATLVTVANDVKLQVEFNPAQVSSYRLLGYEGRILRSDQFKDDKVDAGEIGAGQSVTAFYELVRAQDQAAAAEPKLKYQAPRQASASADTAELFNTKIRFKRPGSPESGLLEIPSSKPLETLRETSADFRFGAAVASFGMLLRDSPHKGSFTYADVLSLAQGATDGSDIRAEFLSLVESAPRGGSTAAARTGGALNDWD